MAFIAAKALTKLGVIKQRVPANAGQNNLGSLGVSLINVGAIEPFRGRGMNQINPKALLHSKWTATSPVNREKHFAVTAVEFDEDKKVTRCVIQAVYSNNEYEINWRDLKQPTLWRQGWC